MTMNVLHVLPFLWCFIKAGLALQCYECDSSQHIACDSGFVFFTQNTKDCHTGAGFFRRLIPSTCTKIVAKGKDGRQYVKRGCGISTGSINNCQAIAKVLQFGLSDEIIDTMNCYICDTDRCNHAPSLRIFTTLGILAACVLYLF